MKCQYLIIQNLNVSFIILKYHDLELAFQQFSHKSKIKLPDIFKGKIFEYNMFISQYFLIFHIYLIIYNNKKNEDKILFIISYFNDILRKWAISILENVNHSFRKDFNIFKNTLNIIYINYNLK